MSSTPSTRISQHRQRLLPAVPPEYWERRIETRHAPLDLAVALVRALDDRRYTVYEHGDRVFVGLGAVRTVEIDSDGKLRCDGRIEGPQPNQFADAFVNALGCTGFGNWRAYGRVSFELAYLLQGIVGPRHGNGPLLTLAVPSTEVIFNARGLLLRCIDGAEVSRLTTLIRQLDSNPCLTSRSVGVAAPDCEITASRYEANVASAIAEMRSGAYDKVVLSRALPVHQAIDLPLSFHAGRANNTPERSFLIRDSDFRAYGFSPETLLEVGKAGWISTQPVAGTRARTGQSAEDWRLREELLRDPKEVFEHALSVRLAIEEMRPLCEPPSLAVSEFMTVGERGSVQHLVSRVRGKLVEGLSGWHAFFQLFPAVTVSGSPKGAALESICRHEEAARGLYGGCVFMVDAHGAMDTAVALRSVFREGSKCWLQAGAGICCHSNPARELAETREKLASVVPHLRRSE